MKMQETLLSRRGMLAMVVAGGTFVAAAMAAKKTGGVLRSGGLRRLLGATPSASSLATAEMTDWEAQAGTLFNVAGYSLRLSGVQALPLVGERPAGLRQRPFIAVFDAPQGVSLPGNLIYRIVPPSSPSFDIYLSDAASSTFPTRMHALFN